MQLKVSPYIRMGFPGGSDSKQSACSAGDLGLIPGSGRFTGEVNGYHSYIYIYIYIFGMLYNLRLIQFKGKNIFHIC